MSDVRTEMEARGWTLLVDQETLVTRWAKLRGSRVAGKPAVGELARQGDGVWYHDIDQSRVALGMEKLET